MPRKRLGEILIDAGVISKDQLERGLTEQRRWGGPLGKILIDEGLVSEDVLVRALGKQLNLPVISLEGVTISESVLATVEVGFAERYGLIPFQKQLKFLDVAMSDPMNMGILDELRIRTQLNVRPHLATGADIEGAIRRSYKSDMDLSGIDLGPLGLEGEATLSIDSTRDLDAEDDFEVDFGDVEETSSPAEGASSFTSSATSSLRDAEIESLQRRLAALEALVQRDEDVIRKLLMLLVKKGVAKREEILEAIS